MKIIADENITNVEAFASLGSLATLAGRQINAEAVRNADALLVRSITKVDAKLLQGSSVKFIASATSGIDHIDLAYLKQHNIGFSYAPGCNANSVVEYVFCALALLASRKQGFDWRECSFGIVGAGNIGGLLARRLRDLGLPYTIYDPFLSATSEHADALVSFEQVLEQDVISIHTPLTTGEDHPSYHLFNEGVIKALQPGKILINAARGAVVDNQAILTRLQTASDLHCILDAWENEPAINLALLKLVDTGTPHIAGYSLDGKLNGSKVIYSALCEFFKLTQSSPFASGNEVLTLELDAGFDISKPIQKINACLLSAYDIRGDHQAMQALLKANEPALSFDLLRKNYPVRKEFSHWRLGFGGAAPELYEQLLQLGFIR